ncbi:MvdC/MvdD family ATP grasp protein [Chloroflexus aurantiacus]
MSIPKRVVIVTQEYDPHADALMPLLIAGGGDPFRLHPADLPTAAYLRMELKDRRWVGLFADRRRKLELTDIRAVWWRRPARHRLPESLSADERHFAQLELEHALRGFWATLDCHWVSAPESIRAASYKPAQLVRAASLGLEVPRTLITTETDAAREFIARCGGRAIYKVLSDPMLGFATRSDEVMAKCRVAGKPGEPPIIDWSRARTRATYTTLIDEHNNELLESINLAPCQFQEYIPKRHELRVTVVGDDLFVAEIHSQQHARTTVDWRHYDVTIPYKRGSLPIEIAERCMALVRGYGLTYAAIDLIVAPDGRHVFLEINPNGQWLWVAELVQELRIAEALAELLLNGKSSCTLKEVL